MSLHLVAYDLDKPGQQYEKLTKKLEALGTYFHIQQSVWLVGWNDTAYKLAQYLEDCLDRGDKLFVSHVSADSAWSGYRQAETDWLRRMI